MKKYIETFMLIILLMALASCKKEEAIIQDDQEMTSQETALWRQEVIDDKVLDSEEQDDKTQSDELLQDAVIKSEILAKLNFKKIDEWTILSKEEIQMLMSKGEELVEESGDAFETQDDTLVAKELILIVQYKDQNYVSESMNPSLFVTAEYDGVTMDNQTYLAHTIEDFESQVMNFDSLSDIESMAIGQMLFAKTTGTIDTGLSEIIQTYLVTTIDQYKIIIVMTTNDEGDFIHLDEILNNSY